MFFFLTIINVDESDNKREKNKEREELGQSLDNILISNIWHLETLPACHKLA